MGGSTEEVRANGLVGLDDHVITLSNADINEVSCVGLDGDKVRSCIDG